MDLGPFISVFVPWGKVTIQTLGRTVGHIFQVDIYTWAPKVSSCPHPVRERA